MALTNCWEIKPPAPADWLICHDYCSFIHGMDVAGGMHAPNEGPTVNSLSKGDAR